MPIDREETLKKAEKLLRQGKLEGAIAEYIRVVEDQPRDWTTANTLGDLYVRSGQPENAAAQYSRIAEHFMVEGFFPKAAAIYKKLLKLTPNDEAAELNLAEISQKQGLLADAKARLNGLLARRRNRGDRGGAGEIVVRLGALDPADFEARLAGARTLVEMGRTDEAAGRFRSIYDDLMEKERPGEALEALRQAVELNPYDHEGRAVLARAAVAAGDFDKARDLLDRQTAGDDPALQMALLEIELKAGRLEGARALLPAVLERGREDRQGLIDLAWSVAGTHPDATFAVIEALVDSAVQREEFGDAATLLQEFATRIPRQIPALLKLVEVCVDGGLEAAMYEAQAELADAYLATGQAAEARVIAEDLVAREPWERGHIERFRRALVMMKVHDPDTVIANRLSGQEPFTAKDVFAPAQGTPFADPVPAAHEHTTAPEEVEGAPVALMDLPPDEHPTETWDEPEAEGAPGAPQPGDLFSDEAGNSEAFDAMFGQSGGDDGEPADEHLALARTYLDMSMPDEAIGPLKEAFQSPRLRFEAASLLGRLYREQGQASQAIEWLERALSAPAPGRDDGHAVLYDLGVLLEENGDRSRARALFLELQADAGNYRDVAERVERLARVETGG